ncbi:MAG: hypothetical protein IJ863_08465 [Spirochaetales bacterium]|nr:hypothetical protein [Spirochaetales bacterium]
MKKFKTAFAILLVFFSCQAVFAGFVPVGQADKAVVTPLAAACDVLRVEAAGEKDAEAFYFAMASATDKQIDEMLARYGVNGGYVPVTSMDDLALLFPRGVEEADRYDSFKRAAAHLGFLADRISGSSAVEAAKASFSLVGYDFVVELADGSMAFKYLDVTSAAEDKAIADALMAIAPGAVSCAAPKGGRIDIKTNGMTQFEFDVFCAATLGLIYDTIY